MRARPVICRVSPATEGLDALRREVPISDCRIICPSQQSSQRARTHIRSRSTWPPSRSSLALSAHVSRPAAVTLTHLRLHEDRGADEPADNEDWRHQLRMAGAGARESETVSLTPNSRASSVLIWALNLAYEASAWTLCSVKVRWSTIERFRSRRALGG